MNLRLLRRTNCCHLAPKVCAFLLFQTVHTLQLPPLVYSPFYSCDWPIEHRFPMSKFKNLHEYIVSSDIFNNVGQEARFFDPPFQRDDYMKSVYEVHDTDYVNRFINYQLSDKEIRSMRHLLFFWNFVIFHRSNTFLIPLQRSVYVSMSTWLKEHLQRSLEQYTL